VAGVAQLRLVAFASRERRVVGRLDPTPSFEINLLGPVCLSASLRCVSLTGNQPACVDAPVICEQTDR